MKSTKTMVCWGGERDDETLEDVMNDFRKVAPSARFVRYGDVTSGGWPVYEILVEDQDAQALADFTDRDVSELDTL